MAIQFSKPKISRRDAAFDNLFTRPEAADADLIPTLHNASNGEPSGKSAGMAADRGERQ